jgi:hypothetical protein
VVEGIGLGFLAGIREQQSRETLGGSETKMKRLIIQGGRVMQEPFTPGEKYRIEETRRRRLDVIIGFGLMLGSAILVVYGIFWMFK